jgi:hypothetical protein
LGPPVRHDFQVGKEGILAIMSGWMVIMLPLLCVGVLIANIRLLLAFPFCVYPATIDGAGIYLVA